MANFRDTLIQTVRDRFPKGGWNYGGLIRELIIEPLCLIGGIIDAYIDDKLNLLDIRSLVDNPAENEEKIDEWLQNLNLSSPEAIPATGSIVFVKNDSDDITVMEGSTFTWNDTYTVYAAETIEFNDNNPLTKISDTCYIGEVPVTTGNSVTNISLAANSPMNWNDAPDSVYDVYVNDAVCGGRQAFSIQQKAKILENAFSENGICGVSSIYAALSRMFPDSFIDVQLNRTTDKKHNNVSLFLKQKREAVTKSTKYNVIKNGSVSEIVIETSAVYSIDGVYSKFGYKIDFDVTETKNSLKLGDYGSTAKLTLKDCDEEFVIVKTKEFSDIKTFMSKINEEVIGTPFTFSCELPATAIISLQIPVDMELPETAIIEIQEYIAESKLNATIYDSEIASILTKYDTKLTGSILYSGDLKTGEHSYGFSSVGHLSLAGHQGLNIKTVALYTSANLIKGIY